MIEHKGSIGHIRAPEFSTSLFQITRLHQRQTWEREGEKMYLHASRFKQHRAVRIIPPRSGRVHNTPQESVFDDRVLLLLTLKPDYRQPRGPLSESASCIEDTIAVNNQELKITRGESNHFWQISSSGTGMTRNVWTGSLVAGCPRLRGATPPGRTGR